MIFPCRVFGTGSLKLLWVSDTFSTTRWLLSPVSSHALYITYKCCIIQKHIRISAHLNKSWRRKRIKKEKKRINLRLSLMSEFYSFSFGNIRKWPETVVLCWQQHARGDEGRRVGEGIFLYLSIHKLYFSLKMTKFCTHNKLTDYQSRSKSPSAPCFQTPQSDVLLFVRSQVSIYTSRDIIWSKFPGYYRPYLKLKKKR
jgi:hypothetical protein